MTPPALAFVGTGPVARALALTYAAGGGTVAAVVSRSAERAAALARRTGGATASEDLVDALIADVIVVAVPDRVLPAMGLRFAALPASPARLVLHTSGSLTGDVLRGVRRAGSLHPLQSLPNLARDEELAARVPGTHWFHEGDGAAEAAEMVAVWRGTLHRLSPGGKALYHAGAAVLSNHAVALFDASVRLFEAAGVSRDESRAPLAALLAGTAANLASAGVPAALTGPVARGDADTVRQHLDAIAAAAPELLESYVALARRALVVAREKGSIATEAAAEIERLCDRAFAG